MIVRDKIERHGCIKQIYKPEIIHCKISDFNTY